MTVLDILAWWSYLSSYPRKTIQLNATDTVNSTQTLQTYNALYNAHFSTPFKTTDNTSAQATNNKKLKY